MKISNQPFIGTVFIILVSICYSCIAQEWFMLPFPGGKPYKVTQGNFDDPKITQITPAANRTHLKNSMKYAFDFAMPLGDSVVSPAPCVVATVSKGTSINKYNYGFGDVIVIQYSDQTYGKFAHLSKFAVTAGQILSRGQLIAFSGNTGNGTGAHLHYQRQDRADPFGAQTITYATFFKDVYYNNGKLLQGNEYYSLNFYNYANNFFIGKYTDGWHYDYPPSRAFALSYYKNGKSNVIGWPQSDVHKSPLTDYWIQDFEADGNITITLVLTPICKLGKWIDVSSREPYFAYPLVSQMRNYWLSNNSIIGTPISNEYYSDENNIRYTVQLFYGEPLGVGTIYEVKYNTSNGSFARNALSISNIHIAENSVAMPIFSGNGIGGGDLGLEDEDEVVSVIRNMRNYNGHMSDNSISLYDLMGRKFKTNKITSYSAGNYIMETSNLFPYRKFVFSSKSIVVK